VTRGRLPQRAGSLGLTAERLPPRYPLLLTGKYHHDENMLQFETVSQHTVPVVDADCSLFLTSLSSLSSCNETLTSSGLLCSFSIILVTERRTLRTLNVFESYTITQQVFIFQQKGIKTGCSVNDERRFTVAMLYPKKKKCDFNSN